MGVAVAVIALHLTVAAPPAGAQAVTTVVDAVNIRFGVLDHDFRYAGRLQLNILDATGQTLSTALPQQLFYFRCPPIAG
jgi:hypothetical protein